MERFTLMSGPCAVEGLDLCLEIGERVKAICEPLGIRYIFKASYKKANRTKLDSFTGIGDEQALEVLKTVGEQLQVETITDVHESPDPARVAPYVDHLQIPAFLCRQTDLLIAAGKSGKGVNIKKGQFLSPEAMRFPLEKVQSTGNLNIWLCERGTTFGYQDLVVDATSITRMKSLNARVIMDCTHATQKPNRTVGVTGGDPEMVGSLAYSAIVNGADGLFIETHPRPAEALSDGQSVLQLDRLEAILKRCVELWDVRHAW